MANKIVEINENVDGFYEPLMVKTNVSAIEVGTTGDSLVDKLDEISAKYPPKSLTVTTSSALPSSGIVKGMCPCGDGYIMCGRGFINYSWDGLTWQSINADADVAAVIANGDWVACASDTGVDSACVIIDGSKPLATSPFKQPEYLPWSDGCQMIASTIIIIPRLVRTGEAPKALMYEMMFSESGRPACASKTDGVRDPMYPEYPRDICMIDGKAIVVTSTGAITFSERTDLNAVKRSNRDPEKPSEDRKTDAQIRDELRQGYEYTVWRYPIAQWKRYERERWVGKFWPYNPDEFPYGEPGKEQRFLTTLENYWGTTDNAKYITCDIARADFASGNMEIDSTIPIFVFSDFHISPVSFGGFTRLYPTPEGVDYYFDDTSFRPWGSITTTYALKPMKRTYERDNVDDIIRVYAFEYGGSHTAEITNTRSGGIISGGSYNICPSIEYYEHKYNGENIVIYDMIHNGYGFIFATDKGVLFNMSINPVNTKYKWYQIDDAPCTENAIFTSRGSQVLLCDNNVVNIIE